MLHPKQNRIDYGNQLIPPDGYSLDQAIGTTYSLDLEALMVLPVALFYSQPMDGKAGEMRYDMLDAITKAAEKIVVYCQKGRIKSLQKFHSLLAYWEKGIEQVQMPSSVQSFHPKVWVIRYVHPEDSPRFRILITSRNLTFARDWDIAFSSEGTVSEEVTGQNSAIINFLLDLQKRGKRELPVEFLTELTKVKFDKDIAGIDQVEFHPIGIADLSGQTYVNPILEAKWYDQILIVSPFVDNKTLESIAEISGRKKYLLSRKEELDGISEDILRDYDCFQFSRIIEESELNEDLDESDTDSLIQNLHAKLFITQIGDTISWYLGSANCTDPAQTRNVEFLVELRGKLSKGIKPGDVLDQLTNPARADGVALFEHYDHGNRAAGTEGKQLEYAIRRIRYHVSELIIRGEAVLIENGTAYNLKISIYAETLLLAPDFDLRVRPVFEENKKAISVKPGQLNIIEDFTGYPETRLSPFLEFEIWHNETMHSSFLLGMEIVLPKGRLNKIFSSIINSRDKFLEYLGFLLTGEETSIIPTDISKTISLNQNQISTVFNQLPVYEKLLIAASRHPEKLSSIDKLMERLKSESAENLEKTIGFEFEEFWQIFRLYYQSIQHAD
jgi:hypothetical protein